MRGCDRIPEFLDESLHFRRIAGSNESLASPFRNQGISDFTTLRPPREVDDHGFRVNGRQPNFLFDDGFRNPEKLRHGVVIRKQPVFEHSNGESQSKRRCQAFRKFFGDDLRRARVNLFQIGEPSNANSGSFRSLVSSLRVHPESFV
ncbi:MAG: hypothetical protein IT350_01865 [Deltaproteobacteria bacterium]|nr:hypothetical protein [Deltaproteobacteria bacterium]